MRKKTFDKSVEHIAQSEQTQERDSKPNTTKNISLPRKQIKISQINKKFFANKLAEDFANIKRRIMNCYFYLKSIPVRLLHKRDLVLKKRLNSK